MTGSSTTTQHHVRVVARIRPLSQTEQERGSKETITSMQQQNDEQSSTIGEPELIETNGSGNSKRWFELDAVFDPLSTQEYVYEKSGARNAVCQDIFKGYNATILAYGQTGSGKTHTMGTALRGGSGEMQIHQQDGMIPRACIDLFQNVSRKCDGNARVELSYLEIYNEEIRDLLSLTDNHASLKIRETLNGEVYVSGLTSKQVTTPNQVGKLMEEASKKRVVASTAMNAVSSRSHAICTLKIAGVVESNSEIANSEIDKFTSKLTLVDLAGSERIKKTGAEGNRRQEGISINKGLFVLGQVVSALSDSRRSRKPPYRESKLTRLLQDSLGGNSRTIMVACVSPADCNLDESINTLRYATSARKIKSNATRNIVKNISPQEAAALRRENQLLKNEVAELQETVKRLTQSGLRMDSNISIDMNASRDDSTHLSTDSMEEDACRISSLEKEVAMLKKQLKRSQAGLQESTRDAGIELPAMKVELELLRQQVEASRELEEENVQLVQQLDEARSDADSARIAAAKLSAILDQLKELRRDEIDKKKEELKYMKKDEAWVVFMDTLLEGRADRMKKLSEDFELVLKVLENPHAFSASEELRNWWGTRKGGTKDVIDPELRTRVIKEHLDFFKLRMGELQQDIQMESQSLREMRVSIQKDCAVLQAEIGKDESKEERINKVGQQDMLAKLKKVWASPNKSFTSPQR